MPTFANWSGTMATDVGLTESADRLVGRNPTTLTVTARPAGGSLPGAQVVRIEPLNDPRRVVGEAYMLSNTWVTVIGYSGHATVADTDLKVGDEFLVASEHYVIHAIRPATPGHFEAYARATR